MDPLDLDVEACRACLATDVKLYTLSNTECAVVLAEFTKSQVQSNDGLSHFICYICRAKLCNFAKFRDDCRRAHFVQQDIRARDFVLSKKHIASYTKFTSNYAVTKLKNVSIPDNSDVAIKSENELDDLIDINDDHESYNDDAETSTDIKIFTDERTITDSYEQEFKIDDDFKVLVEPITSEITSDKIVLKTVDVEDFSLKEGFVKKKTRKKTKVDKNKEKPVPKKKKKKLYNEKFEEDFEEFCKKCNVDVVFLNKEQQIQRLKEKGAEGKYRLKCDLCYAGFMTESAHKKHLKMHDPSSGEYECEICRCRYAAKVAFQRHKRLHKKEFVCKLCDKVLINSHRAKMHHLWHEGFKPECKHCHKKFNAQSSYLNHVRENHTPVQCKLCEETLEGTIALSRHKNEAHSQCKTCCKQFKNYEALTTHTDQGCQPNLIACTACGAAAADEAALRAHETQHFGWKGNTKFKCENCPSSFSSDRALGAHFALVHAHYHRPRDGSNIYTRDQLASSYLCELCAKSFNSPIHLKTHQTNVHSETKPFQCPHCPKAFTDKTKLAVHINTHTGERPFKCKQCPETFKSYAQRYKHRLLVHSKERPHKCRLCEKAYVLSNDLKWHVRYAHLHEPRPPRARRRPAPAAGAAPGAGAGAGAPLG